MRDYEVLELKWRHDSSVYFKPIATLTAPSPGEAIRIAKQKGHVAPVVAPKDPQ